MHHAATLADWAPVAGIAAIIAVVGIVLWVISVRSGQYRDPEAAKFHLVDDDSHPAANQPSPPN